MITDYSRNPGDFAVNRYAQIVPVKQPTGYYLNITPDQAARIISATGVDWRWPDGQEAPLGNDNHKEFAFAQFLTQRYAFAFNLGDMAVDHAPWDILALYARMAAQQAMTLRSVQAVTALTTSGNYASGNTASATSASGGKWDVGTAAAPYIKKGILAGAKQIHKASLGAIKMTDLHLVIDPDLAVLMAASQEIHSYLQQSPFALAQVRGDAPNQNGKWGLPSQLYGVELEIESCVQVTSRKGATLASQFLMADNAALVARPGSLTAPYGGPSFSFLTQFMLEEMTVESKHDVDNRRHTGRVVENYQQVVTASVAGYLFTDCSG